MKANWLPKDMYERAKVLRYKKPALKSIGYQDILDELQEITEACADVTWMTEDEELLLSALDGDEDDLWEFKMTFSDLSGRAESLLDALYEQGGDLYSKDLEFDDTLVALIGNRYTLVGWDSMEEDYMSLTGYDAELAVQESGKRLMRKTKPEILSVVGQSVGIAFAFLDIRYRYDYLKATIDVIRDGKTSILKTIREIEKLYEKLVSVPKFCSEYNEANKHWEDLMKTLPQRTFLE